MFTGSSINTSPTIAVVAGAAIPKGAGIAVKFDATGAAIPAATKGEAILGFLILQTADDIKKGESMTVQTCCKGKAVAGGAVAAGDMLAVDAAGKVIKAETGNFLVGQALEAGAAGDIVSIEIIKGGKV